MGTAGSIAFHVGALMFYLYIWKCQLRQVNLLYTSTEVEIVTMRKYAPRYLTKWSYAMQTIYLLLCVVQYFLSMIKANKLRDKLIRQSDYLYTSIASPVALTISLVFWTFFIYDRQLIFPRVLDEFVPLWINHSIHTLNSVFAIMDIFFVKHRFPTWTKAMKGMARYLILYTLCLFGTYFHSGVWLYPIFGILNWPQRILFGLLFFSIVILMHGLLKFLHMIVWGSATNSEDKPKISTKIKQK